MFKLASLIALRGSRLHHFRVPGVALVLLARYFSAVSKAYVASQPSLSALLGVDAVKATLIPASEEALRHAISQTIWFGQPVYHPGATLVTKTGDYQGAIKDFQRVVEQGSEHGITEERLRQRREWIRMLQTNQNPFTEELLQQLRDQQEACYAQPSTELT